jgi:tripartite-type tricarboxylate transporter receptor subunit TctC
MFNLNQIVRSYRYFAAVLLIGGAYLMVGNALADTFPQRAIRLISPVPAGGAPDLIARIVGQQLSSILGQPVVVETKVGVNGELAADHVARSSADGYTLLVGMDSLFVINPFLLRNTLIDANAELTPVATLGANQQVLAISPNLPIYTLPEFVDYVKKAKVPPAYASGGVGSQHQMTMEMLRARAGLDMLHVPYKGAAAATNGIMTGEVTVMFAGTSISPLIKGGKLRALAVSGPHRSKILPDVPTLSEFYPGLQNTIWIGLFAPKGTPQKVLDTLRRGVAQALKSPKLIEAFAQAGGIEPLFTSPEEMRSLIQQDQIKYSKIIRDLKIQAD